MHTDDHILETFLASNKPLAAIASDLSITLIALVRWMDSNVDLLAAAKRAMETRIAFLALHAEAVALTDLTTVSQSSTNEERKRKSASQLLRHTAKRLLSAVGGTTNPAHDPKAPRASKSHLDASMPPASLPSSPSHSTHPLPAPSTSSTPPPPNAESRMPNALSSPNVLPSTNPGREPKAPCASKSQLDASLPPASLPSSSSHSTRHGPAPSTSSTPPSPNAESRMPNASSPPNAESRMPNAGPHPKPASPPAHAPLLNFTEHEIDVLMATLAHHFNLDLSNLDAQPAGESGDQPAPTPTQQPDASLPQATPG